MSKPIFFHGDIDGKRVDMYINPDAVDIFHAQGSTHTVMRLRGGATVIIAESAANVCEALEGDE